MASENGQTISHQINAKRIHFAFNECSVAYYSMNIYTNETLSMRSLFLYINPASAYCLQFYDHVIFFPVLTFALKKKPTELQF